MTFEELEARLKINRDKLDEEIMEQAILYNECAKSYAEAAGNRDLSNQILDQLAADLSKQVRITSIDKVTENKVKEAVESDPSYVNQYRAHLNHKKQADYWLGLMKSYDQRAKMLSEMSKLFVAGYWSVDLRSKRGPDDVLVEQARAARRAAVAPD